MEYERIDKVQTGLISPTKLRMKLAGSHQKRKKDGSNGDSARTSPSKLEDNEFLKNSLLASKSGDFGEEVSGPSLEAAANVPRGPALDANQGDKTLCQPKENGENECVKVQQFLKAESGNSSAVHPVRALEDENLDYDSNASSSSFEFHKERSAHGQFTRSFSRPMSSKWNDAEKWIRNRQNVQNNSFKKNALHNQANRMPAANMMRISPDLANYDPTSSVGRMADTKRVDFCQPASQTALERFSFTPLAVHPISGQAYGGNPPLDQCTESKELKEVDQISCTKSLDEDTTVLPVIRSVCMRDMGTEMTPIPSQEPSMTSTPVGATTPLRSPTSSIPSTPQRGAPAPTPTEPYTDEDMQHSTESGKKELTEQELKLKTRREIVALGVQLGKMNIATWASKDDREKTVETANIMELEQVEFEKRAAAWEDVEKSKHLARYKREELKIQAWESQQKAKLEAEMRKVEAQVEQMRAQAQAKMVKKIAMTRQKSEEKRAAAEARKNRDAERTAAQVEYIRQTGQMPSSHNMCCGWLS